jgi:hypothetical protein
MKRIKEEDFIVEGIEVRSGSKRKRNVKIGKFYCCLNGKVYPTLKGLCNGIRPLGTKEFYDTFYKTEEEGFCKVCNKETTFEGLFDGYNHFCKNTCFPRSSEFKEVMKNKFKNPETKSLFVERSKIARDKQTLDFRKNANEKRCVTLIERYGVDYLSKRTTEQWKRRTPEQIMELTSKASETKKQNGTLDSGFSIKGSKQIEFQGKTFYCQGFEDCILDFLINDFGLSPEKIHTGKDCLRVLFDGNKSGYYRPDIFLEDLNLYIEVKSNWTFFGKEQFFNNVVSKQESTIKQGFLHIIFVLYSKEIKEDDRIEFRDVLNMVIRSQDHLINDKVQRLWGDTQYRPIAFGSGSTKRPKWMVI